MQIGLDCVMVNAYGIMMLVMASVARGIFRVMVTMAMLQIVTMKCIGKTVMEGVFGKASHVHRPLLLA